MDDSFDPIIPYGFFSEDFLDLNDSSLILHYDPDCVIPRLDARNTSFFTDGCSGFLPSNRPMDYIHVSRTEKFFSVLILI